MRSCRSRASSTASLDVGRDVLVHGDFHHHNILASARGHLAIDPKPMLGEPEYDVALVPLEPAPVPDAARA